MSRTNTAKRAQQNFTEHSRTEHRPKFFSAHRGLAYAGGIQLAPSVLRSVWAKIAPVPFCQFSDIAQNYGCNLAERLKTGIPCGGPQLSEKFNGMNGAVKI